MSTIPLPIPTPDELVVTNLMVEMEKHTQVVD